MVYEDTAERHRFDSFCKVVLCHAMLDCFREFSYQNKWLVSLNYLPQPIVDGICTTDQYPSDYITFSADGYTLQISNEQMLIDTFINAIFLYDEKMALTFNYKEGTATITFDDLKTALVDQKTGSDLDCSTAPNKSYIFTLHKV